MAQDELFERILSALGRIEARLSSLGEMERALKKLGSPSGQVEESTPKTDKSAGILSVPGGGNEEESWLTLSEEHLAALMAPFANQQRIKLLKALYLGFTESNQLKEFTGLSGGQLYHHLKELAMARFLTRQVRGEYRLSAFGYYAFSAFMILAADLLAEQAEEELVEPLEIDEMLE